MATAPECVVNNPVNAPLVPMANAISATAPAMANKLLRVARVMAVATAHRCAVTALHHSIATVTVSPRKIDKAVRRCIVMVTALPVVLRVKVIV